MVKQCKESEMVKNLKTDLDTAWNRLQEMAANQKKLADKKTKVNWTIF